MRSQYEKSADTHIAKHHDFMQVAMASGLGEAVGAAAKEAYEDGCFLDDELAGARGTSKVLITMLLEDVQLASAGELEELCNSATPPAFIKKCVFESVSSPVLAGQLFGDLASRWDQITAYIRSHTYCTGAAIAFIVALHVDKVISLGSSTPGARGGRARRHVHGCRCTLGLSRAVA